MSTDPLIGALWRVIADQGWRGVTAPRLAAEAGLSVAELVGRAPHRPDLLRLAVEETDRQVREGTVAGQGGTPRDRLFDVLMRRMDALQPHRPGVLRLLEDMRTDPVPGLALAAPLARGMRAMLEAADLSMSGPQGAARAAGLLGVWLATLRAWAKDESADLGPTMAALDRALDRAEQAARSLGLDPGDRAPKITNAAEGF